MSTSSLSSATRDQLRDRLEESGRHDLAARLAKCGQPLVLRCGGCHSARTVMTRCDLKWCPSCQRALAARTADRYARIMHHVQWPLFVTMTALHRADDEMTIRDHRRAWGKFRRLRWFRARVPGGVVAWEVTRGDHGLHVHAHALFDCRWLAVDESAPGSSCTKEQWKRKAKAAAAEVSEQWSLCCRRPANVKVRRVWSRDDRDIRPALIEVLKYAVKGADLCAEERPGRIIDELDSCRLVTSFGSCFGKPEFRRQRSAPAMCTCGCTQWLPEEVLERQVMREARRYK